MKKAIVVGGGLAGLSATLKLAALGVHVTLLSVTKVKRSHSVCAQGGINAALEREGEEDSPLLHAFDTLKGGDFLANQPPVLEMCIAAPHLIQMMARFGCPFNRTEGGGLDFRRFGGTLSRRTVFCGASTGQQLLYALDEQVRRYEVLGLVQKRESHEFLRLIVDEQGRARGVVLSDIFNLKIEAIYADAVVVATGGIGWMFRKSTNSTFCTGAANGRLFLQGMAYANGEFIQIHPTAIPGEDKMRLMSESARGEGGRIWVFGDASKQIETAEGRFIPCGKTGEPWYFLEELYPAFGNLVPRDIGSREVLRVCEMGLGVDGKDQVYLDVRHLPQEKLHKIAAILETYQKFTGEDPKKVPMRIFPAMHYSMGGAWVDWPALDASDREERFRQMTNIPGCFSAGEADYEFHGANRLGANALLSCIFGGLVAGVEADRYLTQKKPTSSPEKAGKEAIEREEELRRDLFSRDGKENVHLLHEEMASWLVSYATVKRDNQDLERTIHKLQEMEERYQKISLDDRGRFANQTYLFANQFRAMLALARVIVQGALLRQESRGAHFKPPLKRDDANWLKTTIASYNPTTGHPQIWYEPVDTRYVDPMKREYTTASHAPVVWKNLPSTALLEASWKTLIC